MLGGGSNGSGRNSLVLFGSGFRFSLLKPHGELTLGHPEVLDVGGSMVEERNLAGLLV